MRNRPTADPKVLVGVLLMVAATALGGVVMQRASMRQTVWQIGHGVAAGTRLTASDVHVAEVVVNGVGTVYADARESVVGKVLKRDLASGELLPLAALGRRDLDHDRVTVPVDPLHLPPTLRRGQRVDVWLTPRRQDGSPGETERVLEQMLVDSVAPPGNVGRPGVVLTVPRPAVAQLVRALRLGDIDLVGVGSAL